MQQIFVCDGSSINYALIKRQRGVYDQNKSTWEANGRIVNPYPANVENIVSSY